MNESHPIYLSRKEMKTTTNRLQWALAGAACLFLALSGCSASSPTTETYRGRGKGACADPSTSLGAILSVSGLEDLVKSGPKSGFAWNDVARRHASRHGSKSIRTSPGWR